MSVNIKYKGDTISSISTTSTKTLKTSGKYCEADIVVENTQDGGSTPTGTINITQNGTHDVTNYATANVNVSSEVDSIIDGSISGDYINNTVTSMHGHLFRGAASLTGFYSTSLTRMEGYCFYGATALTKVVCPNITYLGSGYNFQGCYNLLKAIFKNINMGNQAGQFSGCTKITYIDMGSPGSINGSCFYNCSALKTLVLRKTSVVALTTTGAFTGCDALEGIYVPDDLVDSYKTAANWLNYSTLFKPLSELEEEYND